MAMPGKQLCQEEAALLQAARTNAVRLQSELTLLQADLRKRGGPDANGSHLARALQECVQSAADLVGRAQR